jgi:hypothetical protein
VNNDRDIAFMQIHPAYCIGGNLLLIIGTGCYIRFGIHLYPFLMLVNIYWRGLFFSIKHLDQIIQNAALDVSMKYGQYPSAAGYFPQTDRHTDKYPLVVLEGPPEL